MWDAGDEPSIQIFCKAQECLSVPGG
jgi:hypothetical protein